MADLSVEEIIEQKAIFPRIVNPSSHFVVITYWWGRGNLNKNTSRPCLDFYEKLLMRPFIMFSSYTDNLERLPVDRDLYDILWKNKAFKKFYRTQSEKYARESNRENAEETERIILDIVSNALRANRALALRLQNLTYKRVLLEKEFKRKQSIFSKLREETPAEMTWRINMFRDDPLKAQVEELAETREQIKNEIKRGLRAEAIPALERALMYTPPLLYEDMILRWERLCEANNCNHMAVEYPEFSLPGGYQKAINAKPLFIRKALKSCAGLAVVYIDGDMTIQQYPHIFDMEDIDFMARGWNIDPRASYRYRPPGHGEDWTPGIEFDPYVFETSGGIMYFSNSMEAHGLLNNWVDETAKPGNKGKADDRIISLIFNTRHLLAPMKILQLPIEYLWLTMEYDYSVGEDDWNPAKVYFAHPECLTSEDTAGSQGASSSRQPKFYEVVDIVKQDRSEWLYESVMFPSKLMVNQFQPWLEYIGNATYYGGDLEGDAPFYVVPWGSYGRKNATLQANQLALSTAPNISAAENRESRLIMLDRGTFTIINILRQFTLGHDIMYVPDTTTPGYMSAIRNVLALDENARLELIFADTHGRVKVQDFFQFTIDLDQPVYIRYGNPLLYVMLALCANMDEFSTCLRKSYQFLSRIRVHVLKSVKRPFQSGGTSHNSIKIIDHDTDDAFMLLYGNPRVQRVATAAALSALHEMAPIPTMPILGRTIPVSVPALSLIRAPITLPFPNLYSRPTEKKQKSYRKRSSRRRSRRSRRRRRSTQKKLKHTQASLLESKNE